MLLIEIVLASAARMQDVEIDVDTAYETVAIGEDIFLQGDDARAFIELAESYYEQCQDVTIDECYACAAEPYVECLS